MTTSTTQRPTASDVTVTTGRGLRRAIRGELSRLFGTRMPLIAIILAALSGLVPTGALVLGGPGTAQPPMPDIDSAAGVSTALGLAGVSLFVPALIGTIAVTSEYRHRTIGATFLAVPRRGQVLLAKLLCYAGFGLTYGLIVVVAAAIGLYGAAALRGMPIGMPIAVVVTLLLRIAVTAAIYMIIGVAIGALARHQLAAVGIVLGYFYFLEYLLMIIPGVNAIYPFLPGGAAAALTQFTFITDSVGATGTLSAPGLLPPVAAAAVLIGYAAVASCVAVLLPLRRDLR
ncbi:ABC transporter permease [Microlunatus soli]|uniref:ABC-2 family transporter protein n=1 Tax=Microlunatus soli TaxID=630515 RepID=A0A1H1Q3Y4_9ACTN|nr:ABC transporter permease [Microlunatus soli]SDS18135.1 hypothetical protein SAMN04489812_1131 [Microlunatus soli]